MQSLILGVKKVLWELNLVRKESVIVTVPLILDPAFSFSIMTVPHFIAMNFNTDIRS